MIKSADDATLVMGVTAISEQLTAAAMVNLLNHFWVDPAEKLIAIQMIQVPLVQGGPYRRPFRNLIYQAMVSPE